jgi:hypothetical protein
VSDLDLFPERSGGVFDLELFPALEPRRLFFPRRRRPRRLELVDYPPCPDCGGLVGPVTGMCAACHFRGWWTLGCMPPAVTDKRTESATSSKPSCKDCADLPAVRDGLCGYCWFTHWKGAA